MLSILAGLQTQIDKLGEELTRSRQEWKGELKQTAADLQSQWRSEALSDRADLQQKMTDLKEKLDESVVSHGTKVDILDKKIEIIAVVPSSHAELQQKVDHWINKFEQCLVDVNTKIEFLDNDNKFEIGECGMAKPKWSDIVSQSQTVDNRVEGMAVEVSKLQKLTTELQENSTEQDEQNKRRNCAIIQGLAEPLGNNTEEKQKIDADNVTDLLHRIHCDNISVSSCFRLGKISDNPSTKPRPIKLILASEAQKVQVLQSAKNLKGLSNGLAKVFIHQDLTQKQRANRQQLVKVLKERLAKGETKLIIIGDRIVTRRPKEETREH